MLRRHRKGHITRTRNRDAKGIWPAIMSNKQCYLLLKIVDGPTHTEFIEDNCETRMDMRAYRWQDFKIKNQSEDWTFNLQMDRTFCIPPEDAMLAQDKYLSTSVESLVRPADISSEESHLWHTAGGDLVFCVKLAAIRTLFHLLISNARPFSANMTPILEKVLSSLPITVRIFRGSGKSTQNYFRIFVRLALIAMIGW